MQRYMSGVCLKTIYADQKPDVQYASASVSTVTGKNSEYFWDSVSTKKGLSVNAIAHVVLSVARMPITLFLER